MKVTIETPLSEMTLRRYEKPINATPRDLVRKLCLSLGLLQPGDSRDIIVDIFLVLLENNQGLTSKEVEEFVISYRQTNKMPLKGIASSNVRRQIKRLRDVFLIEKRGTKYIVKTEDSMNEIFREKIIKFYLDSILNRIGEYFKMVDEQVRKK
ncbi:MAG: hypothetical protein WC755_05915 [Candidatus Woesearchaeota archaeon]|jgi:hypothetical protein